MPQILHRGLKKCVAPYKVILMLRVSVLLAHGILPHQIPAPLMAPVPFLQPLGDGQCQGAPLPSFAVIIPRKIQVGLSLVTAHSWRPWWIR